jgi:hypothetical protein
MVFFSPVLFSQYLEPGDIAIFIDNYRSIGQVHDETGIPGDPVWDNYNRLGEETISLIDGLSRDSPPGKQDAFQKRYAEFMNCPIPGAIEKAYRKAGWKHKGHQKFFSIVYGLIFVISEKSSAPEDAGSPRRMDGIFHEQDTALILNHLDDLKFVFLEQAR